MAMVKEIGTKSFSIRKLWLASEPYVLDACGFRFDFLYYDQMLSQ